MALVVGTSTACRHPVKTSDDPIKQVVRELRISHHEAADEEHHHADHQEQNGEDKSNEGVSRWWRCLIIPVTWRLPQYFHTLSNCALKRPAEYPVVGSFVEHERLGSKF